MTEAVRHFEADKADLHAARFVDEAAGFGVGRAGFSPRL